MLKCEFKKIEQFDYNYTCPARCFDYISNGDNSAYSLMHESLESWEMDSEACFPNPRY